MADGGVEETGRGGGRRMRWRNISKRKGRKGSMSRARKENLCFFFRDGDTASAFHAPCCVDPAIEDCY